MVVVVAVGRGGQSIVVKPPPLTGFLGEQAHALTDVPLSQIESRCVCYRQESWRKKKNKKRGWGGGGGGGGEKRWGGLQSSS